MSRKQFTTLILELRVPQPPGCTQKSVSLWIREALLRPDSPFASYAQQVQLKLTGKKTQYL